ncbi:MAG: ankyrin repeat domain-containing protein, partial [Gemmatimonadaceae bacterium]
KHDPAVRQFEDAVDALVTGNLDELSAALHEFPDLVTRRSTRAHHSTLLHYISANGVENDRQVTPGNIVEIARLLLRAGAMVDAESDAYGGGSTTLGLTATSAHPRLAGVQNELIDLLVDRGASIGELTGARSIVRAALDNGCPEAAVHLVQRGARLDDIVGAAGVGRVDAVQRLYESSSVQSRESALLMAAQCDRPAVVEFLLGQGVDPLASDGMSVLHWAAANCNILVMQALVSQGAGLETLNKFDGTVLSSTLWFAYNASDADFARRDFPGAIDWLLAAGARDDFYPEMRRDIEGVFRRAARTPGSSAD